MEWNFKHEETKFEEIPVGTYRVRIGQAEKAISKTGNDMLILTLDVSGFNSKLRYYVPFLPNNPEITNRNLTRIFDCFKIEEGDFNLNNWIGKSGVCTTQTDEYGAKVKYFITRAKQETLDLPPWHEGGKPTLESMPNLTAEDIPF